MVKSPRMVVVDNFSSGVVMATLHMPLDVCWELCPGKHRRLVADEPVEVQDLRKLTNHVRRIYREHLK